MRIGILTYHWVYNFGANLQTLATINYIKAHGYIPIVIDYRPLRTEVWYKNEVPESEVEAFRQFSEKFYNLTDRCENIDEVKAQIKKHEIEAVIIGSDSLFNLLKPRFQWQTLEIIHPSPDHVFPNPFWGNIGCKHSGLSISSQNSNYNKFKKQRREIGQSLLGFEYLSVRDNWTQELVSYYTNGELIPNVCPDPVFSFNTYGRDLIIPKDELMAKFNIGKDYILYNDGNGILSNSWIDSFKSFVKGSGKELIRLPHTLSKNLGAVKWPLDPIEWYSLLVHSNGYVGILMHPIVVCLHNCVPFYSIDHYGLSDQPLKSSKIYHIIAKAGFLGNYCSLVANMHIPSSHQVWDALNQFNKTQCKVFAERQESDCLNNFANALNSLI